MFWCMGSRENFFRLVGQQNNIIIPSFRVGISKNKSIDDRVKEACAIVSTQVTYETDHISLLCDSMMSSAQIFFFVFYCNLKEKCHIERNINSKKKLFICEISFFILICQKLGLVGLVQQKIKLPLP